MTTEQIQDHITQHRPKAAYFGRKEMTAMIDAYHKLHVDSFTVDDDLTYCGCLLVLVNEDSHVGFTGRAI